MPKFEKRLLQDPPERIYRVGDIADVDELVTRHELRKQGIDLARIRVRPALHISSMSISRRHDDPHESELLYNPITVRNWDSEDFYVMLAHESAHLTQPLAGLVESNSLLAAGFVAHKDDRWELDAQIWEARQATKFGWDDERYRLFVDRTYAGVLRATFGPDFDITDAQAIERLGLSDRQFLQRVREEAEARPASFATMRRRPVTVRTHLRRIKQLEPMYGKIESTTLVGSRATNRARKDSDWDYVVVTRSWRKYKHLPHRLPPMQVGKDIIDVTLDSRAPYRKRRRR